MTCASFNRNGDKNSHAAFDAYAPANVRQRVYAPGSVVINRGDPSTTIRLVKSGWIYSSVELANGSRQIVDIFLRGDFIEPMALSGTSHVTLQAVDYATTAEFPYSAWNNGPPAKADRVEFFAAEFARMRAIRLERVVSLGRRDATRRTAHLLLEFAERLQPGRPSFSVEYECPLTQADLADILGMTAIHINRTLRELREMKFLIFKGGTVCIFDTRPVADFAEFSTTYLKRGPLSTQADTPP